jgi:hypothetical protein
VHDPTDTPRHFELNAEPGSYSITGAPAGLSLVTVVYAVGTADGWHLAANHDDLVAYGTELLVVVAFVFVGARLVARRIMAQSARPSASSQQEAGRGGRE